MPSLLGDWTALTTHRTTLWPACGERCTRIILKLVASSSPTNPMLWYSAREANGSPVPGKGTHEPSSNMGREEVIAMRTRSRRGLFVGRSLHADITLASPLRIGPATRCSRGAEGMQ